MKAERNFRKQMIQSEYTITFHKNKRTKQKSNNTTITIHKTNVYNPKYHRNHNIYFIFIHKS